MPEPRTVALQAFFPWLVRNVAHLHAVSVYRSTAADTEGAAIVASCLTACSIAGQLLRLCIAGFVGAAWTPALVSLPFMGSLQSLIIGSYYSELRLSLDLRGLTMLRKLSLAGRHLVLDPSAQLPASLTSLHLSTSPGSGGGMRTALPNQVGLHGHEAAIRRRLRSCRHSLNVLHAVQVAILPRLHRLDICFYECSAASLAPLTRLTCLTRLSISGATQCLLPAGLSLHSLQIQCQQGNADLGAALASLTQLTCLALEARQLSPAAIAGLRQLQLLWWCLEPGTQAWPLWQLPQPLAAAHSLLSLRLLVTHWRIAAASLPALAAMPALAEL